MSAGIFLRALGLGMALGLCYDALRPLRPGLTVLSDGIFLLFALHSFLVLGFGVCAGDLRLGWYGVWAMGFGLWLRWPGRLVRPVFFRIWGGIFHFLGRIFRPAKNFFKISVKKRKKPFAYGKK